MSKTGDSPRDLAVEALYRFDRTGAFIQDTLDQAFDRLALPTQRRAQAGEIAYGACRRLITLDHLIARQSDRPRRKLDPHLLAVLRTALYQLLYMESPPDYAVIDEAVQQAKRLVKPGVGAFVNAVLRRLQASMMAREPWRLGNWGADVLPVDHAHAWRFRGAILPVPERNPVKHMSLAFGIPPWLLERWLKAFDREPLTAILAAQNRRPALTVRINRRCVTPEELASRFAQAGHRVLCHGTALQLTEPAAPDALPGFAEGLFSVQDLSAQAVAPLLAPQPGEAVLDLCAAPGGKTTHLAELMDDRGELVAADVSAAKLDRIRENAARLGLSSITTALADQVHAEPAYQGHFDAVLLDVPCGNSGVLARRVEVRHTLRPATLKQLADIQFDLLCRAVVLLKPRGRIVYSTCSLEAAENQRVIERFRQAHPEFELAYAQQLLPHYADPALGGCAHDGGYAALLKRTL